jgi:hypothetical protein
VTWQNFTLEVKNVNDDPVIETADILTIDEDQEYLVDYNASDIDPTLDILTWSLNTNADWLTIDPDTGILNGTPDNDDVGTFWVEVTVSDGKGGSMSTNFTLEVVNVNDAPMITNENVKTCEEDEEYRVDYEYVDLDPTNDTITWSLDTNAPFLKIDSATGVLSGTPGNQHVGTYWVNITADDGNGGVIYTYFNLEVINVNDPPVITTKSLPNATEDSPYSFVLEANDVDSTKDVFTWAIENGPSFLSINPLTGNLTGTPTNAHVGTWPVRIIVSDGKNGSCVVVLNLTVINTIPMIHRCG